MQGSMIIPGPAISKFSNDCIDTFIENKELCAAGSLVVSAYHGYQGKHEERVAAIVVSSMIITAIIVDKYQSPVNHKKRQSELELIFSRAAQDEITDEIEHCDDDFDFEKFAESDEEIEAIRRAYCDDNDSLENVEDSYDDMPPLERVFDPGTPLDHIQAIQDVDAWSQQQIIVPAVSGRTIPPVRGSATYNFEYVSKK